MSLAKEGAVFPKGGEYGRTCFIKGDHDRGGSSTLLFFLDNCKAVVARGGSSFSMDTT